MKVIFLDIDGVLNSSDWYRRRKRVKAETWDQYHAQEFDPECVKIIKAIIDRTGAKVVLSSTWRLSDEGVKFIKSLGIELFDCTPHLPRPSGASVEYCERGKEIQYWIGKYMSQDPSLREDITHIAIIDDDTDMLPEQQHDFFNTDNNIGLTNDIAQRIILHLNRDHVKSCYSCNGKGFYTQMTGLHGAEDFGGDGFDLPPNAKKFPCSACDGTGKASQNNLSNNNG